jgi:uncharacterized membrane protein YozB (DUF420 family)
VEFDVLPAISSALNVATTVLLLVGWTRIRRKDADGHRRAMLSALATSAVFLVTYLVHHAVHPWIHRCAAEGATLVAYRVILTSHTILAVAIAVLAPRVAWLGLKGRLDSHRRLAKITLPVWLYVSVTGVVVYLMAYHLWPAVPPG